MADNLPITVLDESKNAEDNHSNGTKIIGLKLDIFDEPVHIRISVAQRYAKLADIVPLARTLSTKLVMAVLDKLRRDGKTIPCCKGCSACCSYLVPLSAPEVFRMREELLEIPAARSEAILKSSLEAAKIILDNIPKNYDAKDSTKINRRTQLNRLGRWYTGLKLVCPFLSDGLCTSYEQRPTVCREYIVTGSASLCKDEHTDGSQAVQMPISIAEALCQLTAELEQSDIEAVMLPLALPWAQENLHRSERIWPATMMVERFIEIVTAMASKNSITAAASN